MTTPSPSTVAATVVAETMRPSLFSLLLVSERESLPSPPLSDSLEPDSLCLLERDSLEPPSSELLFELSLVSPDWPDDSPDCPEESPEPELEPSEDSPEPELEPSEDSSEALIPCCPMAPGVRHPTALTTPSNTMQTTRCDRLSVFIPDTRGGE